VVTAPKAAIPIGLDATIDVGRVAPSGGLRGCCKMDPEIDWSRPDRPAPLRTQRHRIHHPVRGLRTMARSMPICE